MITLMLMITAAPPPVRVERRPAFQAVIRDVRGDYSQHPALARELLSATRSACRAGGMLFGVYPQDPDTVRPEELRWQLGYRVPSGARCAVGSIAGYTLTNREAETDAILDSTIGTSRDDGLAMMAWLATSRYVQTAPTRMEFVGIGASPSTAVRIVVPVRRRTWQGPMPATGRRLRSATSKSGPATSGARSTTLWSRLPSTNG